VLVEQCKTELRAEKIHSTETSKSGAMIETRPPRSSPMRWQRRVKFFQASVLTILIQYRRRRPHERKSFAPLRANASRDPPSS